MPRRPQKPCYIPPLNDSSWPKRCDPLLEFLDEPRGWNALKGWARTEKVPQYMLRNMVAWLEEKWLIRQDPDTGLWKKLRRS
jgi:hypothetical protein